MTDIRSTLMEWAGTLRSGKYQQCQEQLTDGEGFCCLGVFADMHGIEIPRPNWGSADGDMDVNGPTYNTIKKQIPYFVYDRGISMNDEGKTFEEIADMIDIFVEGYNAGVDKND